MFDLPVGWNRAAWVACAVLGAVLLHSWWKGMKPPAAPAT
jgi:hypothetical protein